MCEGLAHRGPDSRGLHCDGGVGLGIQRLRVIDLVTGDQPVYNEDRSVVVVLNGEVYNYLELREQLHHRGHAFTTAGDAEVIAHLYEDEGDDLVHRLIGMFAFALWDARRQRLLIARDRVGKKPMLYAVVNGALTFASEFGALLQDESIRREVDHQAIDSFLAYQYVAAPRTAYRWVQKLPPASRLVHENGRHQIDRYWQLDYSRKRRFHSRQAMAEELRDHLRRATRRRMIADVPLGAFLSGGVDSAAVVASMAEASAQPVKTFSIGFADPRFNELPTARLVAQRFGTDHHEINVRPDAAAIVPRLVRHYGEPFADSSAIPSFHVAEVASGHVTVALNGDGGDESFAGYQRYTSNLLAHRLDGLPRSARRAVAWLAPRLPHMGMSAEAHARLQRGAAVLPIAQFDRYERQIAFFTARERAELYTADYRAALDGAATRAILASPWEAARASSSSLVDTMLSVDVETYLPGDLLTKMDIASMAHSLEARSPLLDHELMEFAASLPPEAKASGMQKKIAFRQALRGWIPDAVLDGPKRGFCVPLAEWFRGQLRDYVRDVLLDPGTTGRGYFAPAHVAGLVDRHVAGDADHSKQLWALLMHEMWYREFIDGQPTRQPQLVP